MKTIIGMFVLLLAALSPLAAAQVLVAQTQTTPLPVVEDVVEESGESDVLPMAVESDRARTTDVAQATAVPAAVYNFVRPYGVDRQTVDQSIHLASGKHGNRFLFGAFNMQQYTAILTGTYDGNGLWEGGVYSAGPRYDLQPDWECSGGYHPLNAQLGTLWGLCRQRATGNDAWIGGVYGNVNGQDEWWLWSLDKDQLSYVTQAVLHGKAYLPLGA